MASTCSETDLLRRITSNPAIFGGKPIIRNRRLAVEHVLGMLAAGDTPELVLQGYPWLEPDDVRACLVYARRLVGHECTEPAQNRHAVVGDSCRVRQTSTGHGDDGSRMTRRTARLDLTPVAMSDAASLRRVFRDADVRRYLLDGQAVSAEWVEAEILASQRRFRADSARSVRAGDLVFRDRSRSAVSMRVCHPRPSALK